MEATRPQGGGLASEVIRVVLPVGLSSSLRSLVLSLVLSRSLSLSRYFSFLFSFPFLDSFATGVYLGLFSVCAVDVCAVFVVCHPPLRARALHGGGGHIVCLLPLGALCCSCFACVFLCVFFPSFIFLVLDCYFFPFCIFLVLVCVCVAPLVICVVVCVCFVSLVSCVVFVSLIATLLALVSGPRRLMGELADLEVPDGFNYREGRLRSLTGDSGGGFPLVAWVLPGIFRIGGA